MKRFHFIVFLTFTVINAFDVPRQNITVTILDEENTTRKYPTKQENVQPVKTCEKNRTIKIDDEYYAFKELINFGFSYPLDAHFDGFGNLFYVKSGRSDAGFYFDIYVLKSNETLPIKVKGIPSGRGYSVAVDKQKNKVYFGTQRGIYTYDYNSNTAQICCLTNQQIGMIFVDNDSDIYVTELVDGLNTVFLLDNNVKVPVRRLDVISDMAIDSKNDIYFIKANQFRVLSSGCNSSEVLFDLPYNGMGQIAVDGKGRVFVATDRLIYYDHNTVEKVNIVEGVPRELTCLAFDKDGNFVLGTVGKLLKFTRVQCSEV